MLQTSFLVRSVGNIRQFFLLVFRMVWARILLGVRSFRMRCRGRVYGKVFQQTSFLVRSVGNVREFFWLVFRMVRARILLGVRSFRMRCRGRVHGKVFQRFSMLETSFLVRSVGNVRQFFLLVFRIVWARILLGVRSFRMRCRGRVYGKVFQQTSFLVRSVGNVRKFFWLVFRMVRARILLGVRSFRMRCRGRVYGKVFQRFSMLETSFLVRSVGNVRQFFLLVFRIVWARIHGT